MAIGGIPESEFFRLAVEAAPNAMIMIDREGSIVLVNGQTERMFGHPREALLGAPIELLINPDLSVAHRRYREEYVKAPEVRAMGAGRELLARRADGTEFPVEIGLNPIHSPAGLYVLAAVVDITERRKAEIEREELEARVRHSQKLESLGVLAGGIAHDFNNLLTAIMGNADLAKTKLPPGSDALKYVDRVILAGKRAAELTYQMLAYSGKGKFKSKVLNVAESIREIADLLHVSLSKKARIHYDFADNLPTVEADPAQLSQVVLNLVTNANEALGNSSGEIHVRAYPLDADEAFLAECVGGQRVEPGRFVCIEVKDTGSGMDEQTRERIFEPFYTTKFTGRGLGLSAVIGIVHSHKGAIRIESAPRKGTSALVLLPATHDAETRKVPAESHDGFSGGGLVLLADDEEVVRAVTRAQLEALGFEVHEAHDGAEALSQFEAHKYRLAVLDLTMPKMDGDAVARHLQESEPNLPVLLVSGYSAHELTGPLAESPNVRMLAKPFTLEDLRANLEPLLASAPGTQNPPRPGNP